VIRHRVATVGRPGPAWPRAVARWGSGATLPLDATTCVSADELRALVVDAAVDLAIVEAGLPGVDRVLADDVRRTGTALAVVTTPTLTAAAERLDPDALLPADFGAQALAAVLQAHARTRARPRPTPGPGPGPASEESPELVAVTGPGGTGASTVAQALAAQRAGLGPVVLADLALEADQHLRHGVAPGHDGVFELAEALRHAPAAAIAVPIAPQPAGYDLLCGLRRRQEWTILCGSVAEHVLASLLPRGGLIIADIDADLDGRVESGSLDLEERNGLARVVATRASTIVVVGRWSTTGVHRLARTLLDFEAHGIPRDRLLPVLNHAPKRRSGQSLARHTVRGLLEDLDGGAWPSPICLAHDPGVERSVREAAPLPPRFVRRVGRALEGAS
jgi:Mrp family chromosome partitioning ATPase